MLTPKSRPSPCCTLTHRMTQRSDRSTISAWSCSFLSTPIVGWYQGEYSSSLSLRSGFRFASRCSPQTSADFGSSASPIRSRFALVRWCSQRCAYRCEAMRWKPIAPCCSGWSSMDVISILRTSTNRTQYLLRLPQSSPIVAFPSTRSRISSRNHPRGSRLPHFCYPRKRWRPGGRSRPCTQATSACSVRRDC